MCILNYRPPSDYASCERGTFSRSKIPLQSSLISVSIESVGSEKVDCPLIVILTDDCNVQLWRYFTSTTLCLYMHIYFVLR